MSEGGWSTIRYVIVCGAAAVLGFFLVGGLGRDRPASKEEAIAELVAQCQDTLAKDRAIQEHNTEAQIWSACNCVSEELYAQARHLDADMAESDKVNSIGESMGPAIRKCVQRTGLGVSE